VSAYPVKAKADAWHYAIHCRLDFEHRTRFFSRSVAFFIRAPMLLSDLIQELGLNLPIEGASDEKINVPSALADSLPGSITFFSDKRRKSQLETARATACITTERFRPLIEKTGMIALVADDPRALFAKLSGDMVSVGGSQIEDAPSVFYKGGR